MSQNDGDDPQPLTSTWPLWADYVSSSTTVWPLMAGTIRPPPSPPQPSHCIHYCNKCNAVYQFGERLVSHKACNESRLFQPNSGNWFECHSCYSLFSLTDLCTHVATVHHEARRNWDDQFMSYFCMVCKTMFYSQWSMVVRHRMQCCYTFGVELSSIDKRIPSITIIMRRLIKDYLDNGRGALMYACIICKRYESTAPNPAVKNCAMCSSLSLKNNFYCPSCNVVFYCSKSAYDTHLNMFEHFYIMVYGIVDNTAVPDFCHRNGHIGRRRRRVGNIGGRGSGNGIFCDWWSEFTV